MLAIFDEIVLELIRWATNALVLTSRDESIKVNS